MKWSSKEEELKDAYMEIESFQRKLKMVKCGWDEKYFKNQIGRLKMKINKLKFQLW